MGMREPLGGEVPLGYPRLAAFQSSESNFSLYRSFSYLHSRILLDLQDEIRSLEEELDQFDEFEVEEPKHRMPTSEHGSTRYGPLVSPYLTIGPLTRTCSIQGRHSQRDQTQSCNLRRNPYQGPRARWLLSPSRTRLQPYTKICRTTQIRERDHSNARFGILEEWSVSRKFHRTLKKTRLGWDWPAGWRGIQIKELKRVQHT
jgi:hypothetical protein